MRLLITGGAGFIGGHVSHLLCQEGVDIVIYDNLSTGKRENIKDGVPFYHADLSDIDHLSDCLTQGRFDGVIHLAASVDPVESISNPEKYYRNNTLNTHTLLECCQKTGVNNIIFSSTAAVYGLSEHVMVDETAPLNPLSPYGISKIRSEKLIKDFAEKYGMKYVILRYFNVVGIDPKFEVGYPNQSRNLIKTACEVALGIRDILPIYGNAYPTKDGTTIRDYIHPTDLALAHFQAADYLINKKGESVTLNCGYGEGYSVLDVVKAIESVTKTRLNIRFEDKRQGDPIALIADNHKIKDLFNWKYQFNNIEKIIETSLNWQRRTNL